MRVLADFLKAAWRLSSLSRERYDLREGGGEGRVERDNIKRREKESDSISRQYILYYKTLCLLTWLYTSVGNDLFVIELQEKIKVYLSKSALKYIKEWYSNSLIDWVIAKIPIYAHIILWKSYF